MQSIDYGASHASVALFQVWVAVVQLQTVAIGCASPMPFGDVPVGHLQEAAGATSDSPVLLVVVPAGQAMH